MNFLQIILLFSKTHINVVLRSTVEGWSTTKLILLQLLSNIWNFVRKKIIEVLYRKNLAANKCQYLHL